VIEFATQFLFRTAFFSKLHPEYYSSFSICFSAPFQQVLGHSCASC